MSTNLEQPRTGYMTFKQYHIVKENNQDFATAYNWELEFTKKPSGIYLPPDTLIKIRFISCTPPPDPTPEVLSQEVHGWTINQPGMNSGYAGSFSGNYADRIDQSIEYALRNIVYSTDRPLDHTSKSKKELLWDAILRQFNNQAQLIKQWRIFDALLSEFTSGHNFDGTKTLLGNGTFGFQYQMAYVEQKNLNGLL